MALQAVFMPWKSSSGRSNGHPATLDCSGNAGIVACGDGFGRNDWIEAGSGLGRPRKVGKIIEKKKTKKKVKKGGMRDIIFLVQRKDLCSLCLCEREENVVCCVWVIAFALTFMMLCEGVI